MYTYIQIGEADARHYKIRICVYTYIRIYADSMYTYIQIGEADARNFKILVSRSIYQCEKKKLHLIVCIRIYRLRRRTAATTRYVYAYIRIYVYTLIVCIRIYRLRRRTAATTRFWSPAVSINVHFFFLQPLQDCKSKCFCFTAPKDSKYKILVSSGIYQCVKKKQKSQSQTKNLITTRISPPVSDNFVLLRYI